jgi:hypothetical protein
MGCNLQVESQMVVSNCKLDCNWNFEITIELQLKIIWQVYKYSSHNKFFIYFKIVNDITWLKIKLFFNRLEN